MLTGKFPIESVTEGIYGEMIRKCTQMEPAKRYQSVEEILGLLPKEEQVSNSDKEIEEGTEKKEQSWMIPGFRTGSFWKMTAAVFGYGFILCLGASIEFTDGQGMILPFGQLWLNRMMFTLAQIATVLFNFNYRGILDKVPFVKKISPVFRAAVFVASWFIFVVLAVIITNILENVFFL